MPRTLPNGAVVCEESPCPQCPNWGPSGSACSSCGSPLPYVPANAQ